jgi:hypothetical protein
MICFFFRFGMLFRNLAIRIYLDMAHYFGPSNTIISGLAAVKLRTGYGDPDHLDVIVFCKLEDLLIYGLKTMSKYPKNMFDFDSNNLSFLTYGIKFLNLIIPPNPKPKYIRQLAGPVHVEPFSALKYHEKHFLIVLKPEMLVRIYQFCAEKDTNLNFDQQVVDYLTAVLVKERLANKRKHYELDVEMWLHVFMKEPIVPKDVAL